MRLLRPTVLTATFGLLGAALVASAGPASADDLPYDYYCHIQPVIQGVQVTQDGTELSDSSPLVDVTITMTHACYDNFSIKFQNTNASFSDSELTDFSIGSSFFTSVSGSDTVLGQDNTVVYHTKYRVPDTLIGGNYTATVSAQNLDENIGTSYTSPAPVLTFLETSSITLDRAVDFEGTIFAGDEVGMAGTFQGSRAIPSDELVTIEERTAGGDWRPRARPATQDKGSFTFSVHPTRTTQYRAVADIPNFDHAEAVVTIPISLKVVAKASAKTVAAGKSTSIRGAVFPKGRTKLSLTRRLGSSGAWRTVGYRWSDSTGHFAFPVKVTGTAAYRVVSVATALNASGTSNAVGVAVPKSRAVRPTPAPAPRPSPSDAYYANCAAARAAGVAPLYAGEPGYRAGLDRDGDGVACE